MKVLKYLTGLPWLDIVAEDWIIDFEECMDEWLLKLVPIYKVAKRIGVDVCDFGCDKPNKISKDKYFIKPQKENSFVEDGIAYYVDCDVCPDCGEIYPWAVSVNSLKDRYALSWREYFHKQTGHNYWSVGEMLLLPYFDHYTSTFPVYASVMNNINREFRKITGDENVEIAMDSEMYMMIWKGKSMP